ncbi:papilin-like isoform X2 [Penaeus chinensis]|uniref:papilin-like isoform X2 n=1 Tax=Penaeus chinensis TaxID=139456 RepID=UPI001FB7E413|nr:papilin-like isoform X2 [Penaeus chinensis]
MRPILVATLFLSAMASQPVPLIIRPAVLVSVAASQVAGQQAGFFFGQPLARQHFMSQRDHLIRRNNGQVGFSLQAPQPQAASQQQFSNQPVQPAPQMFNNQMVSSLQARQSQQFNNQQASFPQTQPSLLFSDQQPRLSQPQPSRQQPNNPQTTPSQQFNNQQAGSRQKQPGQQVNSQSGQPAPQKVNQLAGSPQTQPSQQLNNQQPSLSQAQPSRQQHDNQRAGSPQRQLVPQQNFSNQQAGTQHPQSAQQFAPEPARRHPLCGVIPDPGECRAAFPRYYFNAKTNQCDCFLYGGCGDEGLESSYMTLNECQATCSPANTFEGPNCKKVFQDDGIIFEPAASLPSLPALSITSGTAQGNQTALPLIPDSVNGASQNNITTQQAAAESIGGASNQHARRRVPTKRHPLCGKMPSPGTCRGAFPRYYYNETMDQCDCFLYGGCGDEGLESSYASLAECQQMCVPAETLEGPACKEIFQDDEQVFEPLASGSQPNPGHSSVVDISNIGDENLLELFSR